MLKKATLSDIAYRYIKERILNKEIDSGEKLNIDNLVEKVQVSKVPIREALKRLQQEGLVNYKTNLGMSVAVIDYDEALNIVEILNKLTGLQIQLDNVNYSELNNTIKTYLSEIKKSKNTRLIIIGEMLCNQLKLWNGNLNVVKNNMN